VATIAFVAGGLVGRGDELALLAELVAGLSAGVGVLGRLGAACSGVRPMSLGSGFRGS
jgi:hypothetical protein